MNRVSEFMNTLNAETFNCVYSTNGMILLTEKEYSYRLKEIHTLKQELTEWKENYKGILKQRDDISKNASETIEKYQNENEKLIANRNELKEWLENLIKENDTTIKKCDQVIFKMGNENRKDTHQHKLIDVCSRESLVFNRILSKMQEIEGDSDE